MPVKKNTVPPSRLPDPEQPAQRSLVSQEWAGPLPPPGALKQFDDIIEQGAERIMRMVEEEQAHRIEYENTRQKAEIEATARGHWLGSAITILAILAAAIGGYVGVNPYICVAIVGLPIATIIKAMFGK